MKLSKEMLLTPMGEDSVLVPVGTAAEKFHGIVRLNETASFLVKLLAQDTTAEAMTKALLSEYDVDEATASASVTGLLDNLREIGALTE